MPNDAQALAAPPNALLTTAQAAAILSLSPRTLEQLRVNGDGPPYFALGRRAVRYRRSDLDAWLAGRRRKSTSDPGPDGEASS